jgi:hypothetical protein
LVIVVIAYAAFAMLRSAARDRDGAVIAVSGASAAPVD